MKIKDNCFQREDKKRILADLQLLLEQPSDKQERPCPGCRLTFPNDPSVTSTKNCSCRCPYAPQMMSSDPDKYPIESNIVPIVYALFTMRQMMPCWSCEGHIDNKGNIIKLPKIWFYSVSEFYPKMVASYLSDLKGKHITKNEWMVSILPFSQSMFTVTYSIEPKVIDIKLLALPSLHKDIILIGQGFRKNILNSALNYVSKSKKSPFINNL